MTAREACMKLDAINKSFGEDLEIIVRASWEGDRPQGNCFELCSVELDYEHGEGNPFIAFDVDQIPQVVREHYP